MTEPINCPFCGGASICDQLPTGYHQVFCRSVLTCGAGGSPRPTREDAIAMWNRRAGQHVQATEGTLFWRCFHCEYVARTPEEGREHFGAHWALDPACKVERERAAQELFSVAVSAGQQGRADDAQTVFNARALLLGQRLTVGVGVGGGGQGKEGQT
jgi:hypothetical protein